MDIMGEKAAAEPATAARMVERANIFAELLRSQVQSGLCLKEITLLKWQLVFCEFACFQDFPTWPREFLCLVFRFLKLDRPFRRLGGLVYGVHGG